MSLLVKMMLVAVLLAATVGLSRWVPRHPRWRIMVIILNLAITTRYMWWRATETLNWDSPAGMAASLTLYLAEVYGFLVVIHHYVIATRASRRHAEPPGGDFLPSVDVFVTTFNESPDILYRTLVGCQAMDYADKTIHVLDDGNRPEIADLCHRLGVGYITRDDNIGAKAGNLNNGLARTTADLVVTFDADHVPVRTFLTETVGFFRAEKVAQVQTAHHFYNPDLFQDRLHIRSYIANEQDLFYHVVQPGRDVYNSSFYCGSGAVFRRRALAEIHGFPTSTITEDLHTSMLLHARGWESVYVNKDLSAGLAPESYMAYVTQRQRWGRGTLQVMLARGGLFLRGLSFMQRLNYFSTLWYWFYGFPRVVYLMSPLLFLLLGLQPLVVRNLEDLLTYYLPHLAVSIVAFQLVNRGMRRIFWSDVYESCISVQVALTALFFPFQARKVDFKVTPKGNAADGAGSARLAFPLTILAALLIAGFLVGLTRLAGLGAGDSGTLINTIWAAYNLVVLGMGFLLLRERPRRRTAPRLPRRISSQLSWNGTRVEARTLDLSETGASLQLNPACSLPDHLDVTLAPADGPPLTLRGRLVRCDVDEKGTLSAALDFVERDDVQHRRLVEMMFSAPDSWQGPHGRTMGAPEHLMRILRSLAAIFAHERRLRRLAPRYRCELAATIQRPDDDDLKVRVLDISERGAALRLPRHTPVPSPERFVICLRWNDSERTTLTARVRDVRRGAGGERLLGVVFMDVNRQQREDLRKQLYSPRQQPEPLAGHLT
ncbi:MAG: glycosyltransferase [Acidobacteria bacterium]|nr:MAG: glycosyltransferase [Acidobacteriota bacterium]